MYTDIDLEFRTIVGQLLISILNVFAYQNNENIQDEMEFIYLCSFISKLQKQQKNMIYFNQFSP